MWRVNAGWFMRYFTSRREALAHAREEVARFGVGEAQVYNRGDPNASPRFIVRMLRGKPVARRIPL